MGQLHDQPQAPARVPSRFEIVNALAWILARADDLRSGGHDHQHALEQALQEHEATLVSNEQRAGAGVYRAARNVWASLADEDDARVLAWILVRASDLRGDGQERHDALEQAIADCQETWERATRLRAAETHEVARYAWDAASVGVPRVGSDVLVDALDKILERALALFEGGCDLGDGIAQALDEHGASRDFARVAFAAWELASSGAGSETSS